jgi:predicted MPP superfamily phosphohydrolase
MGAMTRRNFLRTGVRAGLGLTGLGSLAYGTEIEPEWVEVSHRSFVLPRLAPEFDGFRLVQLSDLHFDGDYMVAARLERVVRLINQQRPDVIALTGDFVTLAPQKFSAQIIAGLSKLQSRHATVGVLGNHDHWTSAATVRRILQQSGVLELDNKVHTLRRGRAALHLAGLDDGWMEKDDLAAILPQLSRPGAVVLLAHEPDFADKYAVPGRFDLQLSGHSHGGQVSLPLLGPPHLPPFGRKYPRGHYRIGAMQLYTNRGIGMVKPYVRLNCRPEIAVITLRSREISNEKPRQETFS